MGQYHVGETNDKSVTKEDEVPILQTLVQDNASYGCPQDRASESEQYHKGDDWDFGVIDGSKVQ